MIKWSGLLCVVGLAGVGVCSGGELAVGGAGATYSGAIRGVGEQSAALPLVYYEGERLSFLFTTVAVHLVRGESFRLSVLGSGRFDGYEAHDSEYLAGMESRDPAFDVGVEASVGNFQLSVVTDATGTHKGTEASLTYVHGIEIGKLQLQFAPGIRWQNERLADYYYGVRPAERATLEIGERAWLRDAYAPGDALVPKLGTLALYRFADRWSIAAGAEFAYLPREIIDSPIVERPLQWGVFAGLAYHFR